MTKTINPAATLTPEQVQLALSYIERTHLDLNRQLTTIADRYAHSIATIDSVLDDPLITRDIGRSNLVAVRAYFTFKRIEIALRA